MKQEMMGWHWHQLNHMQVICTSLQTDNHANISSPNCLGQMLSQTPNQQCQSTEENFIVKIIIIMMTIVRYLYSSFKSEDSGALVTSGWSS